MVYAPVTILVVSARMECATLHTLSSFSNPSNFPAIPTVIPKARPVRIARITRQSFKSFCRKYLKTIVFGELDIENVISISISISSYISCDQYVYGDIAMETKHCC